MTNKNLVGNLFSQDFIESIFLVMEIIDGPVSITAEGFLVEICRCPEVTIETKSKILTFFDSGTKKELCDQTIKMMHEMWKECMMKRKE